MKHLDPSHVGLPDRLAALSEPIRLRIARLVEQQELSVGEVAHVVQLPQSTVSRHLKVLADAGWVERRTEGTATLYRLSLDDLAEEARSVWVAVRAGLLASGDPSLEEDMRRLTSVLAERRTDSIAFFGRVAGEWDKVRGELFGEGFTAKALLALLSRDWVVADLGCGTGNAAELLAPFVREVIAIDRSGPMLDAARKRLTGDGAPAKAGTVRFIEGELERVPLMDAAVDAAVCVLVLHHLPEPEAAVREMRRIVRPGGPALIVDMYEHDRTEYRRLMGHVHLGFSSPAIEKMMRGAGFADVHVSALASEGEAKGPGLFAAVGR